MSRVLQRATATVALMASVAFATTLLAQMPTVALEEGVRRSPSRTRNSTA